MAAKIMEIDILMEPRHEISNSVQSDQSLC